MVVTADDFNKTRPMNELEATLLEFDLFFKTIKLDYFLHASTLLNAVRTHGVLNRIFNELRGPQYDLEFNFGCLAEDLDIIKVRQIRDHFSYFQVLDTELKNSHVFFGDKSKLKGEFHNHWDLRNGFGLMTKFWRTKSMRIINSGHKRCRWWPPHYLDDKDKWGTIKLVGREFKIPHSVEKYLAHYYGPTWRIEDLKWRWPSNAQNATTIEKLKAKGEL